MKTLTNITNPRTGNGNVQNQDIRTQGRSIAAQGQNAEPRTRTSGPATRNGTPNTCNNEARVRFIVAAHVRHATRTGDTAKPGAAAPDPARAQSQQAVVTPRCGHTTPHRTHGTNFGG